MVDAAEVWTCRQPVLAASAEEMRGFGTLWPMNKRGLNHVAHALSVLDWQMLRAAVLRLLNLANRSPMPAGLAGFHGFLAAKQ